MRLVRRTFNLLAAAALPVLAAASAQAQGPAAHAAPAVPPIDFEERSLANGLRVIAIRDTTTPNVMVSMWYEVGSKHDPHQRSGFAHLFEHILSRKTVNMPYNAINRMVDDIGGTRNASTWYDRTNYYEIVPAEYLERMLWTHAERMARPVVDAEVFETERNVVKEELRQRVLAPPYGRLFNFAIGENVYNVLPHRRPTIGSIADLDAATLEDARAFHQAYYGPDSATLIVAGNFDEANLQSLVDRYFGSIPKRAQPADLAITNDDKPITARMVTASGPTVTLPVVGVAYQIPATAHRDIAALEILDTILTRGEHNRLDTSLVKTGLATDVGSDFNITEEQGYSAIYAFVAGGRQPEAVASELEAAVDRLRQTDPSADEVSEAKNELLAAALAERETFSGRAFELGEMLVRTGDPRAADKRLAALAQVTPADVRRAARAHFDPARRIQLRYSKGEGNPAEWANPMPLPAFSTPPPATGPNHQLRAEAERDAPPAPGQPVDAAIPVPADLRLTNGIRVLAARTGEVPIATLTVLLRAGSAANAREKAGLANLVATMASEGTTTRSAEQIASGLERLGASLSTSVIADGTVLSITAPAGTLPEASSILSDIVRNATFPEEDFARERKRALDSLTVELKDPGALASMLVAPVAYGGAAYGTISGGTPESLAALTRQDLLTFKNSYWRPELASIVISGGIDTDTAREVAERAFGNWQAAGAAPAPATDPAGADVAPRTLVVDLPGSGQAAVYAFARGLSRSDAAFYDAVLANSVLGGSSTGRLFNEIRVKRALSYGAYSQLAAQADEGTMLASAQTKNESAAEVAKVFLDEFARISSEPLAADAVGNRKTYLIGSFRRQLQTSGGFNAMVGGNLLRGLEPAESLAYPARINAVEGQDATAAIGRLLSPDRVSIVIVGDAAKFIDKLRVLRPDVEVVAADTLDLSAAKSR